MITERCGFLVRRLHQIWSAHVQTRFREAGYDVTSVQYAVLDIIVSCEGLDQTDVALRIGYDRATTGGLIARLEQAGYIKRAPNPRDRRARLLVSTALGKVTAAALKDISLRADAELSAPLNADQLSQLVASLRVLVEAGNQLDVAPPFNLHGRGD